MAINKSFTPGFLTIPRLYLLLWQYRIETLLTVDVSYILFEKAPLNIPITVDGAFIPAHSGLYLVLLNGVFPSLENKFGRANNNI
jgi:hypothetical protein